MNAPLILASASPQRKTLLEGLGLEFTIVPSTFNESDHPERDPAKRAVALARMKTEDVASKNPGSFVLGCDTLVVSSDGTLLEKPANADEARGMLQKHSGKTSIVHSAVCLIDPKGKKYEALDSSSVMFAELDTKTIDWWIGTELWKDRSGGFQIDGPGQLMIKKIEGDWTSIVGLPIYLVGRLMSDAGWPFMQPSS